MRNKHFIFALLTFALLPSLCAKAATETNLVVRLAGGDSLSRSLAKVNALSFSNDRLFFSESESKTLSAILRIEFRPTTVGESGAPVTPDPGTTIPVGEEFLPQSPTPSFAPIMVPFPASLETAEVRLDAERFRYTGKAVTPKVSVISGNNTLEENKDFTVSYENNVNIGLQAVARITGIGGYRGSTSRTFEIYGAQTVSVKINGTPVQPANPLISQNSMMAKFPHSYGSLIISNLYALAGDTVTLRMEPAAGYYLAKDSVSPVMMGDDPADLRSQRVYRYKMPPSDTLAVDVRFAALMPFDAQQVTMAADTTYSYNGAAQSPLYTVTCGKDTLQSGRDYLAALSNNRDAGTATLELTGISRFRGSQTITFDIGKRLLTVKADSLTRMYGEENPELTYTISGFVAGEDEQMLTQKPEVAAKADKGSDAGTYAITAGGAAAPNYDFIYQEGLLTVTPRPLHSVVFTLSADSLTYTGEAQQPTFSVKSDSTVALTADKDYSAIVTNNTEPGVAHITITGMGNYSGTADTTFVIFEPVADGITTAAGTPLIFRIEHRSTVVISGASKDAPLKVFDASGRQVAAVVTRSDREITVRLDHQPAGLYLLRVNSQTFKVYKQ